MYESKIPGQAQAAASLHIWNVRYTLPPHTTGNTSKYLANKAASVVAPDMLSAMNELQENNPGIVFWQINHTGAVTHVAK